MALHACIGTRETNQRLLEHAAKSAPSLVVDCSQCANPYSLLQSVPPETFDHLYVLEVEMLYKLRDTLDKLPQIAQRLGVHTIVVTTFDRLMNYHDDWENVNLYHHAWELLKELGDRYDVLVAVREGTMQERLAKRYAEVGRWDTLFPANEGLSISS